MTTRASLPRVDRATLDDLRAHYDRRLSPEEFDALLAEPLSTEELARMNELIDWFTRRYPTPSERLRYARRAFRRWTRQAPVVLADE